MTLRTLTLPLPLLWLACAPALAADLVLNEYNAVAGDKWLGNPSDVLCEGPAGETCSEREDTTFGRVIGNGGNWMEFVVVTDHLDLRGWRLDWQEVTNLKAGTVTLSQHAVWSDLRAGTILSFTERTSAQGGLDTDLSFAPCLGDWWINVNTFDAAYVSTTTNVAGDGPGNFSVGNDSWRVRVLNASGAVRQPFAGEGAVSYTGTSVNSREICRLQEDAGPSTSPSASYDDGTRSSFGRLNNWNDALSCRTYQTLEALRRPVVSAVCQNCGTIVLNEYNAVGPGVFLNGGTLGSDDDLGTASDTHFGRARGNGGDWFELVIVADHLDVRGWRFDWQDGSASGRITLSQDARWSDLRAGTLLTLSEWTTAQGGLDTDMGYAPPADRWIHVNTFDTSLVAGTTSTAAGHVSGRFDVTDDRWALTVRDATNATMFGPAGEGSQAYHQDAVGELNVFRLESDPSSATTAASPYDDAASSSSFGSPNTWTSCAGASVTQSVSSLPDCGSGPLLELGGTCPGVVTVDVTGGTPNGSMIVVKGTPGGSAQVPSGPCAGTPVALGAPRPLATLRANGAGEVHITPSVPGATCGSSLIVFDLGSCTSSNIDVLP